MKYNYVKVDASGATLQTIISGMESNLQNMRTLKNQLLQDFTGAGATGYQAVTDKLQAQLDAYGQTLNSVRGAIVATSGSDGLMNVTDVNQANRFTSIGG
ncbi:WXG100 family type VII secretion target [Nocardia sp. NPDC050793]|uniref:WXG100 family type VII secretion target n=1 Tax=Nocardia sp. NPDC050793 TaxID=3155159 RepID=UPI0033ED46E2